jgi:hypothetical protein
LPATVGTFATSGTSIAAGYAGKSRHKNCSRDVTNRRDASISKVARNFGSINSRRDVDSKRGCMH